ncbi:hypothetical protein GCM10010425_23850 [Streptomyces spororaveus]|uniref:Uncharacterized protein n=1 Tax=Streptomyces spororaveus TaxID=284039 RepID=A0ABQ3TGZ1_9ACTN|nr:hypothetical protein Sspor_52370 [Streptomyces spororaveus]
MTPISAFTMRSTLRPCREHAEGPAAGKGGGASEGSDQAADVELLLDELDDAEAAGAAAAVDVEDDEELDDGFEAGVLLDDAPRLSFR